MSKFIAYTYGSDEYYFLMLTESLNRGEIQRYLAALHRLVPQLYIPKQHLDDDDSDNEDYMEVDLNVREI